MRTSHACTRMLVASFVVGGVGLATLPVAVADPDAVDTSSATVGQSAATVATPAQVQTSGVTRDDADPAAVSACSRFADAISAASTSYDDFSDAMEEYEHPDYNSQSVRGSNVVGRTTLRQAAAEVLDAANTPGLAPDIAQPMRSWSADSTKLFIKMGFRMSQQSLNATANEVNNDAQTVQEGCAAAGTHA